MPCCHCTDEIRSADTTSSQTVKLELFAESDNLPPITSSPENTDEDFVTLDSEVEMTASGEEEAENRFVVIFE